MSDEQDKFIIAPKEQVLSKTGHQPKQHQPKFSSAKNIARPKFLSLRTITVLNNKMSET